MLVSAKKDELGLPPRDRALTSGFTLVEVLVVIAILAIMAVTVAISLSAIA